MMRRSQALNLEGRTIWIVDAHGYGKRFIVRAEEILTAFLEVESVTRSCMGFIEKIARGDSGSVGQRLTD
jgi:hypothetical protein